jgi:hypothetical protein
MNGAAYFASPVIYWAKQKTFRRDDGDLQKCGELPEHHNIRPQFGQSDVLDGLHGNVRFKYKYEWCRY